MDLLLKKEQICYAFRVKNHLSKGPPSIISLRPRVTFCMDIFASWDISRGLDQWKMEPLSTNMKNFHFFLNT